MRNISVVLVFSYGLSLGQTQPKPTTCTRISTEAFRKIGAPDELVNAIQKANAISLEEIPARAYNSSIVRKTCRVLAIALSEKRFDTEFSAKFLDCHNAVRNAYSDNESLVIADLRAETAFFLLEDSVKTSKLRILFEEWKQQAESEHFRRERYDDLLAKAQEKYDWSNARATLNY